MALIPHASVCSLECKKRVGRQQTTFTSCQNASYCNEYFLLLWRGPHIILLCKLCDFCCLFHAEMLRGREMFIDIVLVGMIDDLLSCARAFSLSFFKRTVLKCG